MVLYSCDWPEDNIEAKIRFLVEEMDFSVHATALTGRTALMVACDRNAPVFVVQLLLTLGARVDNQCVKQKTALHYASAETELTMAKIHLLLSYDPNLELKNENGDSALILAAKTGKWHLCSKLEQVANRYYSLGRSLSQRL